MNSQSILRVRALDNLRNQDHRMDKKNKFMKNRMNDFYNISYTL